MRESRTYGSRQGREVTRVPTAKDARIAAGVDAQPRSQSISVMPCRSGPPDRCCDDLRVGASECYHYVPVPIAHFKYVIERTAAECGVAEEFPRDEPCLLEGGSLRGLLANPIPVNLSRVDNIEEVPGHDRFPRILASSTPSFPATRQRAMADLVRIFLLKLGFSESSVRYRIERGRVPL
jgi:hypothetical protein